MHSQETQLFMYQVLGENVCMFAKVNVGTSLTLCVYTCVLVQCVSVCYHKRDIDSNGENNAWIYNSRNATAFRSYWVKHK